MNQLNYFSNAQLFISRFKRPLYDTSYATLPGVVVFRFHHRSVPYDNLSTRGLPLLCLLSHIVVLVFASIFLIYISPRSRVCYCCQASNSQSCMCNIFVVLFRQCEMVCVRTTAVGTRSTTQRVCVVFFYFLFSLLKIQLVSLQCLI